jgi:rare lipoprotein A (peptidoglycan hydrolase)
MRKINYIIAFIFLGLRLLHYPFKWICCQIPETEFKKVWKSKLAIELQEKNKGTCLGRENGVSSFTKECSTSYYADKKFHGRRTASGLFFDKNK